MRQEDGLCEETITIWTDSAASLFLIKKIINQPQKLQLSKHKDLLMSIVQVRQAGAVKQLKTRLLK